MKKKDREPHEQNKAPPSTVLPGCEEVLNEPSPKKRPSRGDVVCPVCLLSARICKTCERVQATKWAEDIEQGTTISQALLFLHPRVCTRCRRGPRGCWAKRGKSKWCFQQTKASQDTYPNWFRPDELSQEDLQYVKEI